jgi:hypothetical protein
LSLAAAGEAPVANWDTVRMMAPGTEVRVAAGNAKAIRGKLESVTDGSLIITHATGIQSFERPEIQSISVKKKGHRLRNTFIGMGMGTGAGLGIGAVAANGCTDLLCGLAVAAGVGIGLIGGTVVGVVWPTGGWRPIYAQ